jgi:hypothetical protein
VSCLEVALEHNRSHRLGWCEAHICGDVGLQWDAYSSVDFSVKCSCQRDLLESCIALKKESFSVHPGSCRSIYRVPRIIAYCRG